MHKPDILDLRVFGSLCYVHLPRKIEAKKVSASRSRLSKKRQKLDARAVRGIFVGYPGNQKGWHVLECDANTIITSIHVTFDESDSDAASEIKRLEFAKLAACTLTTFDHYSRTATRTVDFLFYGQLPAEDKPPANDVVLLDDFISSFDMSTLNLAVAMTVVNAYAPAAAPWIGKLISPQVLTSYQYNPILGATQAQKQAESRSRTLTTSRK